MTLLNQPAKLFEPTEAELIAADMQSEDPEWTYAVRHDPTGRGYSLIDVFDEDGEFVATV